MRAWRSEEHTSELQSPCNIVCRLLLEKKKKKQHYQQAHPASQTTNVAPQRDPDVPSCFRNVVLLVSGSCALLRLFLVFFFFFNDTATTEIYTLSLHDALPI